MLEYILNARPAVPEGYADINGKPGRRGNGQDGAAADIAFAEERVPDTYARAVAAAPVVIPAGNKVAGALIKTPVLVSEREFAVARVGTNL